MTRPRTPRLRTVPPSHLDGLGPDHEGRSWVFTFESETDEQAAAMGLVLRSLGASMVHGCFEGPHAVDEADDALLHALVARYAPNRDPGAAAAASLALARVALAEGIVAGVARSADAPVTDSPWPEPQGTLVIQGPAADLREVAIVAAALRLKIRRVVDTAEPAKGNGRRRTGGIRR